MKKTKTTEIIECDQCQREIMNHYSWWRIQGRDDNLTFCSKICAEKYRNLRYTVYEYDAYKSHQVMGNTD